MAVMLQIGAAVIDLLVTGGAKPSEQAACQSATPGCAESASLQGKACRRQVEEQWWIWSIDA